MKSTHTHFLECEVKQALANITTTKASRDDESPAELFQVLKDEKSSSLNMPANLENSAMATRLRLVFIPIPKKGNAKGCSNYLTIALISHASKVMLKILQGRLQHSTVCEPRTSRCSSWI